MSLRVTELPAPLTLPALQDYVARMVEQRGFTRDVERVFVLWVEELGELAEQLARPQARAAARQQARAAARKQTQQAALAAELADVTLYLADLANGLSVRLERALCDAPPWPMPRHAARGRGRQADSDAAPLSEWQAAAPELGQDAAETGLRGLMVAAGQVARVLRKRWSGLPDAEASAHLAAALTHVLRLANWAGIDLTRAIADKERENAGRIWTY